MKKKINFVHFINKKIIKIKQMFLPIVGICFILILLMVSLIIYNLNSFNVLIKDKWIESPIILTILLSLSFVIMTLGVFINYEENMSLLPLYFMVIFFEYLWLFTIYNRMYLTGTAISSIIFLLTAFEMVILVKSKESKLCWTIAPFLFITLLQIAINDSLYKYNIDHDDILFSIPNLTTV